MSTQQLHTNAEVQPSGGEQPGNASHEALVLSYKVGIKRRVNAWLRDAVNVEA
jgi:hypothetical protein